MKSNTPIKVLVVDDSSLIRKLMTRILETEKDIQVIGQAVDGLDAIEKIKKLCPQVVTMDVEMPRLDGIGALRRIMRECPVPVIMLSSLTTEGARATMDALGEGAIDFVPKPNKPEQLAPMLAELVGKIRIASQISLGKVKGCCSQAPASPAPLVPPTPPAAKPPGGAQPSIGKGPAAGKPSSRVAGTSSSAVPAKPVAPKTPSTAFRSTGLSPTKPAAVPPLRKAPPLKVSVPAGKVEVVVIGCSTGGPVALQNIIPRLPADFPVGVVVVQHIPVGFSKSMAEHLNRRSMVEVIHGTNGDQVRPGRVIIAPAGCETHFVRVGGKVTIKLKKCGEPIPPASFRPSVDQVMLAATEVYGGKILGVLLTGMGRDGAQGMLAIRQLGGRTIAQDEATCVVFGMPKAAIELGAAEKIVPLPRVAQEIINLV